MATSDRNENDRDEGWLSKLPRMWGWVLMTIMSIALIGYISPQQLGNMLFKAAVACMVACLAYWIDRSMFARVVDSLGPDMPRDVVSAARVQSRALIFVGVAICIAMAV